MQILRDASPVSPPVPVAPLRNQIFSEMPAPQSVDSVHQSGQHRDPRGFEVQIPAPAILVRHLVVVAVRHRAAAGWNGDHEQRLGVDVPHLAPVEARMRNHDQVARHQQRNKGDEGEPVRGTHHSRVTDSPRPFSLGSRWHAARVARRSPGNRALFRHPGRSAFLAGTTAAPGGSRYGLNPIRRRCSFSHG